MGREGREGELCSYKFSLKIPISDRYHRYISYPIYITDIYRIQYISPIYIMPTLANSYGKRAYCYTGLIVSSLTVAVTIAGTHYTFPVRDGLAELAWVVWCPNNNADRTVY